MPPLPPKIKFLNDTAKLNPLAAAMSGLAYAGQHADAVFGTRHARRRALRPRAASRAQLVGVRGAGVAFDGLYYVTSVTHDDQARRVQAVLHARAQRPALDRPDGARMTTSTRAVDAQQLLRQVPRHGVNNVDPMQIGRIQAIVPDVSGVVPTSWAMPCVPVAGINTGVFTVPPIGSGVWIEFEQGDPDYPIWVGGFWGTAAEVPVLAHAVPPGGQRHHAPDDAQERDRRQRRARARPAGS